MPQISAVLAGIPLPALMIDRDARIIAANSAALDLLGEAALGRHHGLTLRQPDLLAAIAAALEGRAGRVRQVRPGPAHDQIHEVIVTPLPEGVLCAFQDLSALEQMDLMRRDFVANVSHELRTPLTALLGFIETLQGAARNDPAARERFLGIMAAEAGRMNRLVADLLHLSRVESEERIRPQDSTDIAGLIRSVAATMKSMAEAGRVTIRLVGVQSEQMVRADRDQMTQVLTNLIENAVKYGSPPGAEVLVDLRSEMGPRGPQLRLLVQDQGEGIDEIHLPRLTERFYRVDGHRSREKGGTGLGLAIVKHIVNRHRGRLVIASEKGKGSRFEVVLPLDRV
jgi:two-component system phosphate regulon sensor histidine kinase PhoR